MDKTLTKNMFFNKDSDSKLDFFSETIVSIKPPGKVIVGNFSFRTPTKAGEKESIKVQLKRHFEQKFKARYPFYKT